MCRLGLCRWIIELEFSEIRRARIACIIYDNSRYGLSDTVKYNKKIARYQ